MPTTTRSRLRELLGEATGYWFGGTTTSAGNVGGTTAVSSAIQRFDTVRLVDRWLLITSGTNAGEARRISSVSGSTITVGLAYTGQVAISVTYEIMTYDPDILQAALEQAGRLVYPRLYLPLRNETLVVDNLLANFDFETGTFTSWVNIGTPTLAANTNRVIHGTQSASITATGATEGIEQDVLNSLDFDQYQGKTLRARAWLLATVASAGRMRVTFDGTTYTNGPFHSGDDDWEGPTVHRIDATIPANATEVTVSFEVTDGNTLLVDLAAAWVDPLTRYTVPAAFVYGPHMVRQQAKELEPQGLYLPIGPGNPPQSGRLLQLEGMGRLTVPTTDAGTMEIDENQAEYVVALAAASMHRSLANADPASREWHVAETLRWQMEANRLSARPGISMTPLPAHRHDYFSTIEDATSRLLLLSRSR